MACILDIALPGLDGTEICRRMRADGDWTPVIFLTARDDEVDRILGLELGGDDYVTKPFSPRELVTRVKALLRRAAGPPEIDRVRTLGPLTLDQSRRTAAVHHQPLTLTATEFDLLAHLLGRPGRGSRGRSCSPRSGATRRTPGPVPSMCMSPRSARNSATRRA